MGVRSEGGKSSTRILSRGEGARRSAGSAGGSAGTNGAGPGTSGGPAGTSGGPQLRLYLAVVAATVLAVDAVNMLSTAADLERVGRPTPLWEPAVWELTSGLAILALSPLVGLLALRAPVERGRLWAALTLHAAATVPFSLAHVLAMGWARWAVYAATGAAYDPWQPLQAWPYEYRKDLLIYLGLAAIWRLSTRLSARRDAAPAPATEAPVIEVRDGARRLFVRPEEVLWIEAAGNYAELHLQARAVLHRTSLTALEGGRFVRIHRSRLVNRDQVAGMESNAAGDFTVTLRDGRRVAGSRRFRTALSAPATA